MTASITEDLELKAGPRPAKLFIDSLIVDERVQRDIDPGWIRAKLAEGFKRDGLATIVVSERGRNRFHIIDGQHRVELCKQFGYAQPLDCSVHKGLSLADEALMFLVLNDKRGVKSLDKFRIRAMQGDETAVILSELLTKYGWTLRNSTAQGCFKPVTGLEAIYVGKGKVSAKNIGICESVISVISAAWNNDAAGAQQSIIAGLGLVFLEHGNKVGIEKLVTELAANYDKPKSLVNAARSLHAMQDGTVGDAVATILIKLLNKGRRGEKNKLPSWMATKA